MRTNTSSLGLIGLSGAAVLLIAGAAAALSIENPLSWSACLELLLHPSCAESFDAYY